MPVTVHQWRRFISEIANKNSDADGLNTAAPPQAGIDRLRAFIAIQALLRGGIFDESYPIGKLHQKTIKKIRSVPVSDKIEKFLRIMRSANLRSIGVHIVDPIEGRHSTIWAKPNIDESRIDESILSRFELYANAWNRIYRRLFRPSATLINAVESGVLPWQWATVQLPTGRDTAAGNAEMEKLFAEPAFEYMEKFFRDSASLAETLSKRINSFLPSNPNAEELSDIEEVFQKTWNGLEEIEFIPQLTRVAGRFRDSIIDSDGEDPQKNSKKILSEYLKLCSGHTDPLAWIESASPSNTEQWPELLDAIEAIQSSVLSQPEFCDASGLWFHRIDFANPPLRNATSIYIIFGLSRGSILCEETKELIKNCLNNLGKAIGDIVKVRVPKTRSAELFNLGDSLCNRIWDNDPSASYYREGVKKWLFAIDKLAKEARHEGYSIYYNVGYGSLAYAQAHLHRFEAVPDDLSKHDIPIEKISSYIKGFYSIFGNHKDRGLWFDELGQYRGVFEIKDGEFEKVSSGRVGRSQHQDTILYAKIDGGGCFDVLHRDNNQIARIRNGELIDMARGDIKRSKAIEDLLRTRKIPEEFGEITKWLVNELVEVLQAATHGTCFVISFDGIGAPWDSSWRTKITKQVKTLVKHFSQLDAPKADLAQLTEYARAWNQLVKIGGDARSNYKRPSHLFDSLAELANLDGGLWLSLVPSSGDNRGGLMVRAAQQFIPLVRMEEDVQPLDLQMNRGRGKDESLDENALPMDAYQEVKDLRVLFAAINGEFEVEDSKKSQYINALSFLHHSGTKTHSLWGLSLTAEEHCLCVVLSSDGNVYLFHDGREFTGLVKDV